MKTKRVFSPATLLFIFLGLGPSLAASAVYLQEGFNGTGLPSGWTQIRISGSQAGWSVVGTGSNPIVPPYAGTGQAKFNSFDAGSGEQARLISPAINLTSATDPFLIFFMYHEDEYLSSLDSVYVEVSTADSITGPWNTLSGLQRPRTTIGWSREVISLYSYRGTGRLFVSLRGVSKYGNNMYVDEFRVADTSFHDLGTAALLPNNIPAGEFPAAPHVSLNSSRVQSNEGTKKSAAAPSATVTTFPFLSQLAIGAAIHNFGTFAEPSYSIGWRADSQSQTPVSGRPIAARTGRDTLTLSWANPSPGFHTVRAWTILASDSNRTNDTSQVTFRILEPGTVFYESFEGSLFPPTGWSVINRDGGVLSPWFRGADTSAFLAFDGHGFAADNFQRANGSYLDDYLITPPISGVGQPGLADSLIFWVRSKHNDPPAIDYPDSLKVLISTGGADTSNFTITLDYFAVPKTGWTRKAYTLAGRVPSNSTVRAAFRYLLYNVQATGGSGDFIGVDAVQLLRAIPASVSNSDQMPAAFALRPNYPNPFNPATKVRFSIAGEGLVELAVFDILGRPVATLVNERLGPGEYERTFTGTGLASGVYVARLRSGGSTLTLPMMMVK